MRRARPSGPPPDIAAELRPPGPRVYELRGWARMPNPRRVATIGKIGRDAAGDPRLARLAVGIFRAAGVAPRDYRGQAAAIHAFLRDHVYFVNEKNERLQDPAFTLDLQPDGTVGPRASGDCDDFTIAMIALCEAVHLPARAVTSGRLGPRVVRYVEGVGKSPPARWSHIYTAIAPHPFAARTYDRTWAFADPTVPGAPFGWDVVGAGQADPQRGRGDYAGTLEELAGDDGDEQITGLTLKGAAQLVAVGVATTIAAKWIGRWFGV